MVWRIMQLYLLGDCDAITAGQQRGLQILRHQEHTTGMSRRRSVDGVQGTAGRRTVAGDWKQKFHTHRRWRWTIHLGNHRLLFAAGQIVHLGHRLMNPHVLRVIQIVELVVQIQAIIQNGRKEAAKLCDQGRLLLI